MESVTERTVIKDCRFEELLKKFAEPYVKCIAAKYCRNQVVGMEFEELCQEGRMKAWRDYEYFTTGMDPDRPENPPAPPRQMTIHEFVKTFKYDMTCLCLDKYRKVFKAEKRAAYKVIDLDAMMAALSEQGFTHNDQNPGGTSVMDLLPDPKSEYGVFNLETQDLIDYIKTKLNDLEIRILSELVTPSDRLIRILKAETVLPSMRMDILGDDPALIILNRDCPKARQRMTTKTPLWHISVALGESYGKVRGAFDHLKAVTSTLLLEETHGEFAI